MKLFKTIFQKQKAKQIDRETLKLFSDGYFMMKNQVCDAVIVEITTVENAFGIKRKYRIDQNPIGGNYTVFFDESEIFTSREKLLQSL